MSPTRPQDHVGVIDIGTNSVLLLAGRCHSAGPEEVAEEFATTRLGEGLSASNRLRPDAVARTLRAVARYRDLLERLAPRGGVGIACATCAVREAVNRDIFIQPCENLLSGRVLLLSGRDEAIFSFRGATWDVPPTRNAIVIDVGGGSTELARGVGGLPPDHVWSLPVGCVRLTERFGLHEASSRSTVLAARAAVNEVIVGSGAGPAADPGSICVAVGGTATTYAAVRQRLVRYDRTRVHGFRDHSARILTEAERLAALSPAERRSVPGLPSDRAEILPAGLLILGEVLRFLRIPQFRVSVRGLRFGVLLGLCKGDLAPSFRWGPDDVPIPVCE